MKLSIITFLISSLLSLSRPGISEPLEGADNVCNHTVKVKQDITVEVPVKYEIKYHGMCSVIPCQKTRTETRIDERIKSVVFYKDERVCCKGYTETPEGQCAPICLRSCNNGGKCVAPNICECSPTPSEFSPGFVGPTCARYTCLDKNRWGPKCERECNCQPNAYCSANTGKCICHPGFTGSNCTIECSRNSNEIGCQEFHELPPILEPDANLISDSSIVSRQRSEALVLERTPDETLKDDRSSFGANYLVGVLACLSLISLISLLIVKLRYDRLKTEIIYASGSSASSASDNRSVDSGSGYYATTDPQNNDMLSKNLSFAATTRQVLMGGNNKEQNTLVNRDRANHEKLIVNPMVEAHLIRSHKQANQNLYSDVKVDFSERALPEIVTSAGDSDHLYQVPRPRSTYDNQSSDINNDSNHSHDTSVDSSHYKSISENLPEETIYEEIKDL